MKDSQIIVKNGKELRTGYTTGSCAAAAAAAAVRMLLGGSPAARVRIALPEGRAADIDVFSFEAKRSADGELLAVKCAVRKDGGDDPDITSGLPVCAEVFRGEKTAIAADAGKPKAGEKGAPVSIEGGEGVGRVTGPGLACPPGAAAINPVPRQMIEENVRAEAKRAGYEGPLKVVISVPGGEKIAERTFNPRLGIEGGISILGTTGIVEPMSESALIETIKLDIDRLYRQDPEKILLSPGNYGKDFARDRLGLDIEKAVQISNFIGEAIDHICYKGFREILLVGHAGKLIKLASGVMNTHSSMADCRMETIAANAACFGMTAEEAEKVLACPTTDRAFEILEAGATDTEKLKKRIVEKAIEHIEHRIQRNGAAGRTGAELIMFASASEDILASAGAMELAARMRSAAETEKAAGAGECGSKAGGASAAAQKKGKTQ